MFHRNLQAPLSDLRQEKYFPILNSFIELHKIELEVTIIAHQSLGLQHTYFVFKFENHSEMPVYKQKIEIYLQNGLIVILLHPLKQIVNEGLTHF